MSEKEQPTTASVSKHRHQSFKSVGKPCSGHLRLQAVEHDAVGEAGTQTVSQVVYVLVWQADVYEEFGFSGG
jgi:hypothetical protein